MATTSREDDLRTTRSGAKRRKEGIGKTDLSTSSKDSKSEDGVDHRLPERVLARGFFPKDARLNIYSSPEILGEIAEFLGGSSDFERLLKSQFGKLFKYPVCQTAHSAKLIHGLLSRQLVTKKRHELWFVFGGKPLRFSLREFHITTGLECRPIPRKEEILSHQKNDTKPVWNSLFGSKEDVTVTDVLDMLRKDVKMPDDQKMSCWKRFCLVLILLVDGVIVCSNKYLNITPEYVKMLDDVRFFLSYPWGRVAFKTTMERFGPPTLSDTDPITELRARLRQRSSCCYGFPLALQMLAFEAIPLIVSKLPDPEDKRDYTQMTYDELGTKLILHQKDIIQVESNEQLTVAYTLEGDEGVECMDFGWDDDAVDEKVDYMEKLLIEGHEFRESEWPGGDTETSGLVPVTPGVVKKAPARRGGVKKEPARRERVKKEPVIRGGREEKNQEDAAVIKDDGETIDMLKKFIAEQHKETASTLKREMVQLFEGLMKCECGGLRSSKDSTMEKQQEDMEHNTTMEPKDDGKANTTMEQNQDDDKSDDEVISLETGNKKRKRTEEEVDDFVLYERNRWDEAYKGVEDIIGLVDNVKLPPDQNTAKDSCLEEMEHGYKGVEVDIEKDDNVNLQPNEETAKDNSSQGMEYDDEFETGYDSPFAEHNPLAIVPSGLEIGHEETCRGLENRNEEDMEHGYEGVEVDIEKDDNVDLQPNEETAKDNSSQGMEYDDEFPEHNPLAIVPSGLENRNEEENLAPKEVVSDCKTPAEMEKECKRVPRASRFVKGGEYTGDPKLKALFASKEKKPVYHPLSRVNLKEFDVLKQLLLDNEELTFAIVTKHIVSFRFFLDIAEANKPLETEHVQVIMAMLWRRRHGLYNTAGAVFVDTWFLTLLNEKYTDFKACKNKKKFNWGVNIRAFVAGRAKGRAPTTFLQYAHLVYIPMKWYTTHWVGLVINLRLHTVQVFDPLIEATTDEEVQGLMALVLEMIPWLVKEVVGKKFTKNFSTDPLTLERVTGVYQNQRGGDSGPLATKYLEMHSFGLDVEEMGEITEEVVDELRKGYALDAYTEFIESAEATKA